MTIKKLKDSRWLWRTLALMLSMGGIFCWLIAIPDTHLIVQEYKHMRDYQEADILKINKSIKEINIKIANIDSCVTKQQIMKSCFVGRK